MSADHIDVSDIDRRPSPGFFDTGEPTSDPPAASPKDADSPAPAGLVQKALQALREINKGELTRRNSELSSRPVARLSDYCGI
jgi:hypothetical protein